MNTRLTLSRRQLITASALALLSPATLAEQPAVNIQTKAIAEGSSRLPVIGMGTWQTFNIAGDEQLQARCTKVLKTFFALGGQLIDCSPMYGSSADTLGKSLAQLSSATEVFAADKIWTRDGDATQDDFVTQAQRWGRSHMHLMQIHNLLAWQPHLEHLAEMKRKGLVDYLGITTSHGRRHKQLEQIMANHDLDFVQLTYNIRHREVEQRLLPLALERGIAVIANRPYDGGHLIKPLKHKAPIPHWAQTEYGYRTWADLLLGFVVSHPAITCAIPATSSVAHMQENMIAGSHALLPAAARKRLADYVSSL